MEAVVKTALTPPKSSSAVRVGFGFALNLAVVLLLLSASAFAAKHPVALDPKADSATCITCHEDKTKGKAVHSAIAMGCTSCHEVRVNKDITRIKLITTTPYALCLSCHADKNAAEIKGTVHSPAVRDCLKCHDPHTSDNKFQLLKATSGGEKENLCLSCHKTGLNISEKGSRHAALDMGCDTCHVTHKTGVELTAENRFHLIKSAPALCIDCHDIKDAALQKAHQNQPFGTANCVSCHDPHQSTSAKLMQTFTHPPFAEKMCETCHAPAVDGKVVLAQKDVRAICITCHDEQAKKIEGAKFGHPGAQGDCTDCHNPHASPQPGLPKTDAVNICLGCHSEIGDLAKKAVHHQPVFGQGCAVCHEAHGSDRPKLLRAMGNALCLECHGPDAKPQKLEAQHVLTIFDGKVRLPEDYYQKNRVVMLPVKYGMGHPTVGHPVQDILDPNGKVLKPLSCLTCHQPHASAQDALLVKDQANNMSFCDNCHKNRFELTHAPAPTQTSTPATGRH
jgi:predicted CXXCH cytochrome family protein